MKLLQSFESFFGDGRIPHEEDVQKGIEIDRETEWGNRLR